MSAAAAIQVPATSPACASPDCTGQHVRTVRAQAAGSTAWVTVDLCFDCRRAVLDNGHRYVIVRHSLTLHRSEA